MFNQNIEAAYNPGKEITVDEILLPFRGKCGFRMFIPSKKSKFGLKIYCAVDPTTKYLCKAQVYLGKPVQPESNHGEKVILQF
jgi:hypothetical protein